jgi:hypothetical protein
MSHAPIGGWTQSGELAWVSEAPSVGQPAEPVLHVHATRLEIEGWALRLDHARTVSSPPGDWRCVPSGTSANITGVGRRGMISTGSWRRFATKPASGGESRCLRLLVSGPVDARSDRRRRSCSGWVGLFHGAPPARAAADGAVEHGGTVVRALPVGAAVGDEGERVHPAQARGVADRLPDRIEQPVALGGAKIVNSAAGVECGALEDLVGEEVHDPGEGLLVE